MKRFCLSFLLLVSACAPHHSACPQPIAPDVVYVVGHGWHAELGIPAEELGGDLAYFRSAYPGARVIMFGYGKKTFFTAPPQTFSEYVLGPFPGTAVIQAVGLSITPPEAYPPEDTVTLALPPGGKEKLSAFIAGDLLRNDSGRPQEVARSHNPVGMFYAARSRYNLLHTCNTWTAEALRAAGLPVSPILVAFSAQVMLQAENICKGPEGAPLAALVPRASNTGSSP